MKYQLLNEIMDFDNPNEFVMKNRNINDFEHYLNTTDEDVFSPLALMNMVEGAKMLIRNISMNKKTLVIVDSDNDGYTASALLINYLHRLFPSFVENNLTYVLHEEKVHGISDIIIDNEIEFLIVPDAGSSEFDLHQLLGEKGIETLILDHHELSEDYEKRSPYAVIINNQLGDYPNKHISGAGVTYKLCEYIDSLLGVDIAKDFQDLAAVGICGDMMDIRPYETRHMIKTGFDNFKNPFLTAIANKNSFVMKDTISPFTVSFYIVPFINAITRVGTMEEKKILFRSMLETDAYLKVPSTKRGHKPGDTEMVIEQCLRVCTNVKNRQDKLVSELQEKIENFIEAHNLLDNKILIVLLEKGEKGLNGLVANKLMAKYKKPTLILIHNKKEGIYSGSARGVNGSEMEDFKAFCLSTGFPEMCQGHPNAFGFAISESKLEEFIEYTNKLLENYTFEPVYKVDYIINSWDASFNKNILKLATMKNIWGQDLPEPFIAIEHIKVNSNNLTMMKSNTVKITLKDNVLNFIKFKMSQEEYDKLLQEIGEGYIELSIVGTCEANEWNGNINPQIIIKDYEITRKVPYDF
ncbi:MAG: hypothetical protein IKT40_07785 [Bacilli bacterium]|nr:hypothetical protein [Bacilli bacterium]